MKEKKSGILGSSSSPAVIKNNLGLLIAFLVLCVGATAVLGDTFFAWKNFSNVIKQLSTNMFLACGMTLVIMLRRLCDCYGRLFCGRIYILSGIALRCSYFTGNSAGSMSGTF